MIETDVIVVGSGPAGSSAAKHAALGGAKVILMDKKSEIGAPKRCAEGVSIQGLEKLGIEPSPRWVTQEIQGVRIQTPDGTDTWLTKDEVKLPEAGYILERKVFDKHMAMDAARAGAEIRIKTLVTGIEKIENGYLVFTESMGKEEVFKCKILIAADGPEGHVARWAGLRPAAKAKEMESGVQYEMCNVEFEKPGVIEFYLGSCAPGGYVWIFPKGDDIANVGLAILPHMAEKTAIEYLDDFVAKSPYLKNAQAVEINVGGDPVAGMTKKLYDDNILVCGDAAGQVNPLTGGGIISGMTGGMCAGKVAAQAINEENCSRKFLKKYDEMAHAELDHEIKRYKKVQEYLLTLSDEELNEIAHAFEGETFDKISTTEIVKKLIKLSPKALLKLGKFV
ncbi:NAD(P)/FAD-dependent oxidoreductase [uncultured Methanobrevibacter sp.]|uniref:NAD(P)/FAD-dependent oxidoreductase n=2 Tax=uncultured Methanobrevibacter sp. TaxID=253161 RepID=UPI0025F5EF80|nr:NAD(P)/FAD-dependent oxidoreductase [uncultured Methanobrevibacter sp.]MCI6994390.1 NAD(P)/FAD-dependent oxidoreductase [Methanobrevibacter sp.]